MKSKVSVTQEEFEITYEKILKKIPLLSEVLKKNLRLQNIIYGISIAYPPVRKDGYPITYEEYLTEAFVMFVPWAIEEGQNIAADKIANDWASENKQILN